jgi:hypothetical protein
MAIGGFLLGSLDLRERQKQDCRWLGQVRVSFISVR